MLYLTDHVPPLILETLEDTPAHFVTRVCCDDGCGACYKALEHETEAEAVREHALALEMLRRTTH